MEANISFDSGNKIEKQTKASRSKKNKKMFVYIPSKEQEKSSNQYQNEIKDLTLVSIPNHSNQGKENNESKSNSISKPSESKNNNKKNGKNKNNKKKFVYKPSENKEEKEINKNCNKKDIKDNNFKCNNHQISEDIADNHLFCKTKCIEINMNPQNLQEIQPLDWIPVIRDALFKSLERNVETIKFIPGKVLQSNIEIGSILNILVLLTAKRLGFDSNISIENDGQIICKILSHTNSTTFVPHIPTKEEQEYLNTNDTLLKAFGLKKGDNLNIDNLAFRAVKTRFPHMPTICIAIICVHRNPKEAVEFAQLFEDYLRADDSQQSLEIEECNEKDANDINMIKYLEKRYGLNHEQLLQLLDHISTKI
ncbi:hypothetical protein M9Y10_035595 [Tritrichomonas musculus]|uniref:Uncharacterized protein n=1 Tax=Tritrichomonas musculus TaxID=1915356 RepID=A0ABR2GW79_9EUKA